MIAFWILTIIKTLHYVHDKNAIRTKQLICDKLIENLQRLHI